MTERQQEILDACLKVIEKEGLKGFTMRNIALQIGFTDAALYRHFPDKRSIVEAIARLFQATTLETLQEIRNNAALDPLGKLEAFLLGRAGQFQENRALTSILFSDELFRGDGVALSLNNDTLEHHARNLQELISEGQEAGSIRQDVPAVHLVMLLTGSMRQMVIAWKNAPAAGPALVPTVAAFWKTYCTLVRP